MEVSAKVNETKREPACPTCGAPRSPRFRPFCSTRCADVDLQRWLQNRYAIPVGEDEERPDPTEIAEVARQRSQGLL